MNGEGDVLSELAHRAGDAARSGVECIAHAAKAAKEKVGVATRKARAYVAKQVYPQPAGAAIEPCPKNRKAERVAERKARLAAGIERLTTMPAGCQRDALEHAVERFARNNVAVERARLAEDAYNVGKGDPPVGWERVGVDELKKLGMNQQMFPQLKPKFCAAEYKDGYYAELYRGRSDIFDEARYVLAFRGTQGLKDGATDIIQAFGGETDHYSRAIKTAQKLKVILGNNFDITGHSMGGGMATAAGIITGSKTYAIDPAGVHPNTLERFGKKYSREGAESFVQNYVAEGEILTTIQAPGTQQAILVATAIVTPAGACATAFAGRRAVIDEGAVTYGAVGPVYTLPVLVNAADVTSGASRQAMSPGIMGKVANVLNPVRKVQLHGPQYVIAGIEQQKADDLQVMKALMSSKLFVVFLFIALLSCRRGDTVSDIDYSKSFSVPEEIELIQAISKGDEKAVRKLAAQGVNLNAVGEYHNTPLRVAVKCRREQIVKLLFELGVDPNSRTPKGIVAAADDAASEKNPDFLKLFLQFGLDPNLKADGEPLIFFASSEENWPQYEMLLAHGADINSKLPDGSSLMLDLVLQMEYDRAKDLLLKGADFRIKSMHGLNVLDLLVDYQRRMCIDPDLPDCHKRAELLRLLRERGASVPEGLPYM